MKFGFPMASMTVSRLQFINCFFCKNILTLVLQTIVAWGANSFYEGYEKAGQLEWWVVESSFKTKYERCVFETNDP